MLTTIRRKTSVTLSPEELRSALLNLPDDQWQPAILGQQRYFLRLAGIEDKVDHQEIARGRAKPRRRGNEPGGDIFFRGNLLVYVVLANPEGTFITDEYGRLMRFASTDFEGIELGAIGTDQAVMEAELESFASAFENAVRTSLDGRRTRHMDFSWDEIIPNPSRLENAINPEQGGGEPSFQKAAMSEDAVRGSLTLADHGLRELMIFISEAIFIRQRDIFERKSKKQEDVQKGIEILRAAALVNTEYLLECRRRQTRLSRFPHPQDLEDPKIGALICASCGSHFRDELLNEGYSLSELGRELIQKSHWMTIWVTDLLIQLGVPQESIVWNISEGGEEVDIIVEFLGQIWIFELKDREFGAGDALRWS